MDSPSYTLNHEEVEKALEEGVSFAENLTPARIELDDFGHARALVAVAQLEGTPLDALGFWYAARSIAIARAAKSEAAAADIDRYVRSRYRIYRGSEQGWNELLARVVAGERAPPAGFVKSIPHALTPPEGALQVVDEHDPASLSFADWALVLSHRDATPANKAAADKVWKVITDKQQGGGTRLKIPVKVIKATPDIIEAAITDAAQSANSVDLHITMARPLELQPNILSSVTIGFVVDEHLRRTVRFWDDTASIAPHEHEVVEVGHTCQRCPLSIAACPDRAAEAVIFREEARQQEMQRLMQQTAQELLA